MGGKGDGKLRVLIELFDREPIENILGACIFKPQVVVYLCDKRDSRFLKESAIYRLFRSRKLAAQPRFYYFDGFDPVGIRRVLFAVVKDYPGCVFDFSGGRDLLLLVAGACFEEMKLPAYYIDLYRERFINLRGCDELSAQFAMPQFSAEDIFAMSGGAVQGHGHFSPQEIGQDFETDILAVFEIVLKNPKMWGQFVGYLQAICACAPANQLAISAPRFIAAGQKNHSVNMVLLANLAKTGVLQYLQNQDDFVFTFKSPLHRKCLLIEGIWLELYCYITAKKCGYFGDVRTSLVVDWDGEQSANASAKNEVDVFLVRGVTPVFISCKTSLPSPLALSEIKLLAGKFGGGQSRAVVLTAARLGGGHRTLCARAQELGIYILDKDVLQNGTLAEKLRQIAGLAAKEEPRLADANMLPKADECRGGRMTKECNQWALQQ